MEINDPKGKRHLYLDWVAGIVGITKSLRDLVCSISPVKALKRGMD